MNAYSHLKFLKRATSIKFSVNHLNLKNSRNQNTIDNVICLEATASALHSKEFPVAKFCNNKTSPSAPALRFKNSSVLQQNLNLSGVNSCWPVSITATDSFSQICSGKFLKKNGLFLNFMYLTKIKYNFHLLNSYENIIRAIFFEQCKFSLIHQTEFDKKISLFFPSTTFYPNFLLKRILFLKRKFIFHELFLKFFQIKNHCSKSFVLSAKSKNTKRSHQLNSLQLQKHPDMIYQGASNHQFALWANTQKLCCYLFQKFDFLIILKQKFKGYSFYINQEKKEIVSFKTLIDIKHISNFKKLIMLYYIYLSEICFFAKKFEKFSKTIPFLNYKLFYFKNWFLQWYFSKEVLSFHFKLIDSKLWVKKTGFNKDSSLSVLDHNLNQFKSIFENKSMNNHFLKQKCFFQRFLFQFFWRLTNFNLINTSNTLFFAPHLNSISTILKILKNQSFYSQRVKYQLSFISYDKNLFQQLFFEHFNPIFVNSQYTVGSSHEKVFSLPKNQTWNLCTQFIYKTYNWNILNTKRLQNKIRFSKKESISSWQNNSKYHLVIQLNSLKLTLQSFFNFLTFKASFLTNNLHFIINKINDSIQQKFIDNSLRNFYKQNTPYQIILLSSIYYFQYQQYWFYFHPNFVYLENFQHLHLTFLKSYGFILNHTPYSTQHSCLKFQDNPIGITFQGFLISQICSSFEAMRTDYFNKKIVPQRSVEFLDTRSKTGLQHQSKCHSALNYNYQNILIAHVFISDCYCLFYKKKDSTFKNNKFFLYSKISCSKWTVKTHLIKLKKTIQKLISATQPEVINILNKKIFLWSNYYKINSNFPIFSYCNYMLQKYLWKWARRRHPNKNKTWIRHKYFHLVNPKQFGFSHFVAFSAQNCSRKDPNFQRLTICTQSSKNKKQQVLPCSNYLILDSYKPKYKNFKNLFLNFCFYFNMSHKYQQSY